MTSSLPDFSPCPSAAPAADASLTALLPAATTDSTGGEAAPSPVFDLLMGAAPVPTAAVPVPIVATPSAPLVACARTSTRLLASDLKAVPVPAALVTVPADVVPITATVPLMAFEPVTEVVEVAAPAEPATEGEVTRDTLEEAATFVVTLLQSVMPEVQLPELSTVAFQRVPQAVGSGGGLWATGLVRAGIASGKELPASDKAVAAQTDAEPRLFTLTADGAIELNLDLAQFSPDGSDPEPAAAAVMEVSVALEREGEIDIRLEAAAMLGGKTTPSAVLRSALGRAIFAGKISPAKTEALAPGQPAERNFVFTGDKEVKPMSPVAGIAVAKTESTMPVAPIEEARATRNPESFSVLPLRADFQVAATPAERITVPDSAPAGRNFAERAVETVTNLVDTQFNASMQKAGSVHLQLRFGGDDLSVRVEIKDGAVQTDFRTNSAELRSALAREWQVVAAQSPEQMRRYLEPVFSPNSPAAAGADDAPSFSSRQQQHAQQEQASRQSREGWADSPTPFSRRSQLSDSFVPEPAIARGPVSLPTSQRLSVLA